MAADFSPMSIADDHRFENTAPANRPAIAQWPFIVGDVILVASALTMWATAGTLSVAQMFFCLGAVGLGAGLFAIPYVLDYFPAAAKLFTMGNAGADDSAPLPPEEGDLRRQIRAATEAVEHAARANAALESSARRFDARFAPLVEIHKNLETVVNELREAAASRAAITVDEAKATTREFDRLRKEQAEKFKTTEEKIAALSDTLAVLAANVKALSIRPAPVTAGAESPVRTRAKVSAPVRVEEPVLAGVAVAEAPAFAQSEEPTAVLETPAANDTQAPSLGSIAANTAIVEEIPVEGKKAEQGESMLAKALATVQAPSESSAVGDIIQSRPRRSRKSKPHLDLGSLSAPVAAQAVEAPVPTVESNVAAEAEGWQALSDGEFEALTGSETPITPEPAASVVAEAPLVEEVKTEEPAPAKIPEISAEESASSARRSARAKALALRGEEDEEARKNTPIVFSPTRGEAPAEKSPDGLTQGELLAREAESIRKKRSSRAPVNVSTLIARVLIGIGNKPFVRGTGPGLSLDKGVPMEFVEIGQWRWAAPSTNKEPITLRILKNDEVPAEGEAIVLHPGQSLEISPVFPT